MPGEGRAERTLQRKNWETGKLEGGINAGVVILKPSRNTFSNMLRALHENPPMPSTGPEQDFLTRHFSSELKHLDLKCLILPWDEIVILHFSTERKPRDFWLSAKTSNEDDFVDEFARAFSQEIKPETGERCKQAVREWLLAHRCCWAEMLEK
eukprot:1524248-Amphidinium_carterae.1